MSAEKKSRVDLLEKKIFAITDGIKMLIEKHNHLQMLTSGLLSTVKLLNGYEEAINTLKEKAINENEKSAE